MTDPQLSILLTGLIAELDTVIDEAREAMPLDAERERHVEWKPTHEYLTESHIVDGEYVALVPLVALRDAWAERVSVLTKGEAGE